MKIKLRRSALRKFIPSFGKQAIAVQAKDGPTANLCGLCSDLEKSFFCAAVDDATPTEPYNIAEDTFSHHRCLGDLVKSASDGCGLCKVFLHCFLYKHLKYRFEGYENLQAVQESLLASEAQRDSSFLNRQQEERRLRNNNTRKRYFEFQLDRDRAAYIDDPDQYRSGFVTLSLSWAAGYISFLITSEPGSAAHLEGDFIGRGISMYPNFHFVDDLIAECRRSHKCITSQARERRQMPTRLISIRDNGLEKVPSLKLVEWSAVAEAEPYVALSHRWGKVIDCVTHLDNIEERKTNLDFHILPQTFKDAILVSLAHGCTYLWIDCLCIIQDDSQDWEKECPKMVKVYGNADFTIAAVTATDSYAGFLGARNNLNSSNTFMLRYWNRQKLPQGWLEIRYLDHHDPLDPAYDNPLDQRGWTLQERLFSNRVLFFSKNQVFWECNAGYRLESLHFACTNSSSWKGTIGGLSRGIGKMDLKVIEKPKAYKWWYKILDSYCSRSLTFPLDKLPAISGIAAMLQKITSDVYLAGLWQNDISSGLAWRCWSGDRDLERLPVIDLPYRAPSWSWARFDCGDIYTSQCPNYHTGPVHGFVEFISADIKLRGEDPYGQVEEGTRLNIRAPTKQGFIGNRVNETIEDLDDTKVVIKLPYRTTRLTTLRVIIDDPKFFHQIFDESLKKTKDWSEEHEGLQVTTIYLCRYEDHSPEWATKSWLTSRSYGLVLMPVGDGSTLRRIGLLDNYFSTHHKSWTPIDDWFADAEMKELTLI